MFQESTDYILLVGDVLIDRYTHGFGQFVKLGCAGNILKILDFMNCSTMLLSAFPTPELVNSFLSKTISSNTNYKIFKSNGSVNIVDYEICFDKVIQINDTPSICINLEDNLMAKIIRNAKPKILIISDYGLGSIGPQSLMAIQEKIRIHNITTLVDSRISSFDKYAGSSWFFPTANELALYLHSKKKKNKLNCDELLTTLNTKGIFLKRSEQGLVRITKHKTTFFPGLPASEVCDQYGAGDMLIALFACIPNKDFMNDKFIISRLRILNEYLREPGANSLIPLKEFIDFDILKSQRKNSRDIRDEYCQ